MKVVDWSVPAELESIWKRLAWFEPMRSGARIAIARHAELLRKTAMIRQPRVFMSAVP